MSFFGILHLKMILINELLQGQVLHTEFAVDKENCLLLCKKFEGCNWYSFDIAKDNICQMFETCPEIDSNWLFVSGQKECENDNDSGKQYFLPIEYYYYILEILH